MNRRRAATALLGAALALGCIGAPAVDVDRLKGVDLTRHRSFAIHPARSEAISDPAFGPSARHTAEQALVAGLLAQGLVQVDPYEADLLARVGATSETHLVPVVEAMVERGETYERVSVPRWPETVQDEVESEHYEVRHQTRMKKLGDKTKRTVVVDPIEPTTGQVVWRGTGANRHTTQRMDLGDLHQRVLAIVSKFP